jgi:uncharacterized protein
MKPRPLTKRVEDVPSADDKEKVIQAVLHEFRYHPPTIGVIGVSGTGKSSTLNSMFKTELEISHSTACTKQFLDIDLSLGVKQGEAAGNEVALHVVDAPGLGEDVELDDNYLDEYRHNLRKCDVILWVMTARNRAVALDQHYLKKLRRFTDKMVFGINQVDLVDPMDWNKTNLPSLAQQENIDTIQKDRRRRIESTLNRRIEIISYSATHKWRLQQLFTALIKAAPINRAWMFDVLKAFRHDDFLPDAVRERIMQKAEEEAVERFGKRDNQMQREES